MNIPHKEAYTNTFSSVVFQELRGKDKTQADKVPLVLTEDIIDFHSHYLQGRVNRHQDFFALYMIRRGRGMHVIDNTPYALSRGDVYVMRPGAMHYYTSCENLAVQGLLFMNDLFDTPTLNALTDIPGIRSLFKPREAHIGHDDMRAMGNGERWLHLSPAAFEQIEMELMELKAEWSTCLPGSLLLLRGLFVRLLVHLARLYGEIHPREGETEPSAHSEVAVAVRFMEERYAEPLRIAQVAASVFLSADRFTEVFTKTMGRTPSDYLRHLRLERAKILLSTTGLSVTAVADETGFGDPSYFARVFRACTELTPRAYRQQAQDIRETVR